jgi:nicotinamide phosphoribosyltransferase
MNPLLTTDSYKYGSHWRMIPPEVQYVHSYYESRVGAEFPYTVFFGLNYILKDLYYGGIASDWEYFASELSEPHLGDKNAFNRKDWKLIFEELKKKIPISIRAVPEGKKIPIGNVLMTLENTDPRFPWLNGYFETMLSKVWYASTVATLSSVIKEDLSKWMDLSCDSRDGLEFKLHDFGGRSYTCEEQAGIGGTAHLINFRGTDTTRALAWAPRHYGALISKLGYSVPATEHSVTQMWMSLYEDGERKFVEHLLNIYPTGILSIVGDTRNIYNFVDNIVPSFKEEILARDGKFVVRPDSITPTHPTPESQMLYLLTSLAITFGTKKNSKGYNVLNPKVGILWGDGLDRAGINRICEVITSHGFSIDPLVFGMGTGLVQNVNRDTQRNAFKASSMYVKDKWIPLQKNPLDQSKKSKAGRLKLIKTNYGFDTISDVTCPKFDEAKNELIEVFRDGHTYNGINFEQVRTNADNIWQE